MSTTYLTAKFRDKDQVKALGARFDFDRKEWYVPEGLGLAAFAAWLPQGSDIVTQHPAQVASSPSRQLATASVTTGALVTQELGISLSTMMAGVARAVADTHRQSHWTRVEVSSANVHNGNVYLELVERNAQGEVLAQAKASIWRSTAERILPAFEAATGMSLGSGIKLLIRAKPTVHVIHGLNLTVDEIDPQYTLGDLEAKKRDIRQRLQREGLLHLNRSLPAALDYNAVLVVAPQGGAGLGDFQVEADRLQRMEICRFTYVLSRFQGDGAAAEVKASLLDGLQEWQALKGTLPDAVVIIRGGGAANDLAWLNDYDLARAICELPVPVLTGIGHERDSTVLDEVAQQCFDTPSKVIHGIEQVIQRRAREAAGYFAQITNTVRQAIHAKRGAIESADATVRTCARRQLAIAAQDVDGLLSFVQVKSLKSVRSSSEAANRAFVDIQQASRRQLSDAKTLLPALVAEVRAEAKSAVREAAVMSGTAMNTILERGSLESSRVQENALRAISEIKADTGRLIHEAAVGAESLMREIAGQGPEKTLSRGFAMISSKDGQTISSANQVVADEPIEIHFRDGIIRAQTQINGDSL